MSSISEESVPLAAEDRFLIISIKEAGSLCPGGEDARALGEAIRLARPFLGNLIPLFDLRGLPAFYKDVEYFIDESGLPGAHVLVNPATAKNLDLMQLTKEHDVQVLNVKGHSYRAKPYDLSDLRSGLVDPFANLAQGMIAAIALESAPPCSSADESELMLTAPSIEVVRRAFTPQALTRLIRRFFPAKPWNGVGAKQFAQSIGVFFPKLQEAFGDLEEDTGLPKAEFYLRSALFHAFLRRLHRNSLLLEFVMSTDGESIVCSPYHGSALHEIEIPRKADILVGRPALIANKTCALFSDEISKLEHLLNDPSTRERHLQKFLENHPSFLRGMNYSNVYSQIVLQRDDGSALRPDFMLEPYDDTWCDILDLKLPIQSIIVGGKDRATLASGIHDVAAQLREYASYFEEEKYRRWVLEKYGLRVYKPRLIAVVGRDMREMTKAQIRRAMTAYNDVQIITFDQLVRHAKTRLLI